MAITESSLRDLNDKLDFILKDHRVVLKRLDQIDTMQKEMSKLVKTMNSHRETQRKALIAKTKKTDTLLKAVQKVVTSLARSQTALAHHLMEDSTEYVSAQRRDFYNTERRPKS